MFELNLKLWILLLRVGGAFSQLFYIYSYNYLQLSSNL